MKKLCYYLVLISLLISCTGEYIHSDDNYIEVSDVADDMGVPEPYLDVEPYDGTMANDSESDMVVDGSDLYWENCTWENKVAVVWEDDVVSIRKNNADIRCFTNQSHAFIDLETEDVGNVEIILQGYSNSGSVKINGARKFKLTLNGLDVSNPDGPVINSQCGKRTYLHLTSGTVNRLADGAGYDDDVSFSDEDRKGCLFFEGHLVVSGTGVLVAEGNNRHAVATDGFFYMRPGATMHLLSSAGHCLKANGEEEDGIGIRISGGHLDAKAIAPGGKCISSDLYVEIIGGSHNLVASGDALVQQQDTSKAAGIKADDYIMLDKCRIDISCSGSGSKCINTNKSLTVGTVSGCSFTDMDTLSTVISCTNTGVTFGEESPDGSDTQSKAKAIKADGDIIINNGRIYVKTINDGGEGLESKSSITVNNGYIYADCFDDCINSVETLTVNGGFLHCVSWGNDALDTNVPRTGKAMIINGGIVLGLSMNVRHEEGIDCNRTPIYVNGGYLFTCGKQQGGVVPDINGTQCTAYLTGLSVGAKGCYMIAVDTNVLFAIRFPSTVRKSYSLVSAPGIEVGSQCRIDHTVSIPESYDWGIGGVIYISPEVDSSSNVMSWTQTSMFTQKIDDNE